MPGREADRIAGELVPWCSGLTCVPVKDETAGSNPVGTAIERSTGGAAGLTFTVLLDSSKPLGPLEACRASAWLSSIQVDVAGVPERRRKIPSNWPAVCLPEYRCRLVKGRTA